VFAFLSDDHIDPDVAVESFVLVPLTDDVLGEDDPTAFARP
jgi:hypothetical protein